MTEALDSREMTEAERCTNFLMACGKYDKVSRSARANLGRARVLFSEFESSASVNFADEDGWSAAHHACGEGHLAVLEFLTESTPININLVDSSGCTPLWYAAFNDKRECVKHLLRFGADESIKGQPVGEPLVSPALAARRNRHPGLGDLIDAEAELRKADPERIVKQRSGEMSVEEFRESLRVSLKPTESI